MSTIKGCLPFKVLFHQRTPSSKIVFHRRLSSIKGCLQTKVVFHRRSTFNKGCLFKYCIPSNFVFVCHQRLSSIPIKGPFPSEIVFYQRSSSKLSLVLFRYQFIWYGNTNNAFMVNKIRYITTVPIYEIKEIYILSIFYISLVFTHSLANCWLL